MPSHFARSNSSWKTYLRKPAAILAVMALMVTGLFSIQVLTAPKAQAGEWPAWGKPGTIQGYVYRDVKGSVDSLNRGDEPLVGVKINAILVKSDGTVITNRDEMRRPIPLSVYTASDGSYHFNFRKLLQEAYGPNASGGQLKINLHDYVRVWVDPSNYEDGGKLSGLTPKLIRGGERLTKITTLNLSFLGTTNWVQGSISNMNMAFRKVTEYGIGTSDEDNIGMHLPQSQWQPTAKHDIPQGSPVFTAGYDQNRPYLCGAVYSDVTFRYDRFDSGQPLSQSNAAASPDKVVPGVKVVVTSFETNGNQNPTKQMVTRYDYTDKNGRWCVKWPEISEIKNSWASANFLVTLEPIPDTPEAKAQAQQELNAMAAAARPGAYEGVTPAVKGKNGLPKGFGSVGLNGWYGTVRPVSGGNSGVGYSNLDIGCEIRNPYCFPNLQWVEVGRNVFAADTAEMGLIPSSLNADFSRYSQETNSSKQVTVTLNNRNQLDPMHQVLMVPVGSDPRNSANWIQNPTNFDGDQQTFTIPAGVPVGDYSLYTYSTDLNGQILWDQLQDVDSYRVTDTVGHYYEDQATRDGELEKLQNHQQVADSVKVVRADTTLWGAYEDLGEGLHKVDLVKADSDEVVYNLVNDLKSEVVNEDALEPGDRIWKSRTGKDNSFKIKGDTAPGNYRIRVTNAYGDVVDYQPLQVLTTEMTVTPKVVGLNDTAGVELKYLDPDGTYFVEFHPRNPTAAVLKFPVQLSAERDGTGSATVAIPEGKEYLGLGKVTLIKDGVSGTITSEPLNVKTNVARGPKIVLPSIHTTDNGFRSQLLGDTMSTGNYNAKFTCSADCETKYGAPEGTPVYHVRSTSMLGGVGLDRTLRIYGFEKADGSHIDGGTTTGYHWTFTAVRHKMDGAEDGTFTDNGSWPQADLFKYKLPTTTGEYYILVTMTLTDNDNSKLFDTEKFIIYSEGLTAGNDAGFNKGDESTLDPFGAVLEVGEPVPAGVYCFKANYKGSYVTFHRPRPGDGVYDSDAKWQNPYWDDMELEDITRDGDHYSCLTGTPKKTTPNGQFVQFWAWSKYLDKKNTPDKVNPATIMIQDTKAPEITATYKGQEIHSGDTITLTQGDASIPLIVTAKDNYVLAEESAQRDAFSYSYENKPAQINTVPSLIKTAGTPEDGINQDYINQLEYDFNPVNIPDNTTPGLYSFEFDAMDRAENGADTFVVNFKIEKKIYPPKFGDQAPESGKVGTPYRWQIPVEDTDPDGSGKISKMEVTQGQLPPGLSIVPTQEGYFLVANTPVKDGEYTFTLKATDNDAASAEKEFTITIVPPTAPEWDDATNSIPDEIEIPVAQSNYPEGVNPSDPNAQANPWYSFRVKDKDGYTATYTSQIDSSEGGVEGQSMPAGLDFVNGDITGVAREVDEVGTWYVISARYGEDDRQVVNKRVRIKVTDKVAPQVRPIETVSFKVGSPVNIPVSVQDNSGVTPTLHDLKCVKRGETSVTLPITADGLTIKTANLMQSQVGSYDCRFTAADGHNVGNGRPYGNQTVETFLLRVREGGPEMLVKPVTQTVTMTANTMPITPIQVDYLESGGVLDTSDCVAPKFPATVQWDESMQQFNGTVSSLTDVTYSCDLKANDPSGQTVVHLTINVDGPLESSADLNDNGQLELKGIVGRPLTKNLAIKVDNGVTLSEGDLKTVLGSYFPPAGESGTVALTTDPDNGATITGTPSKKTDSAQIVTLKLSGTDTAGKPYSVDLPVKVTIAPAPKISDIPSQSAASATFVPTIVNGIEGETYQVCLFKDPAFSQQIGDCHAVDGSAITVPTAAEGTDGVIYVKAKTTGTTPFDVETNTNQIKVTDIDIRHENGDPVSDTAQGGSGPHNMKGVGLISGKTYTAKLCKQNVTENPCQVLSDSITSDSPAFQLTVPVNGSAGADPQNQYVIKLFENGVDTAKVEKPFTAKAGDVAAGSAEVTGPDTPSPVGDTDNPQVITVKLFDDKGNPVPDQADNLAIGTSLPQGMSYTVSPDPQRVGVYLIKVNSTKSGTTQLQVTYKGANLKDPVAVNFTAGAPDASKSFAQVEVPSVSAGGTEEAKIKVTLLDQYGNPVPNYVFDLDPQAYTEEQGQQLDNPSGPQPENNGRPAYRNKMERMWGFPYRYPVADWKNVDTSKQSAGEYLFPITSARPGIVDHITMRLNDGTQIKPKQGEKLQVEFTFGVPSKENSYISIVPADGSISTGPLSVFPKNEYDQIMAGITVPPQYQSPEYEQMYKNAVLINMAVNDPTHASLKKYLYKVTVTMKDSNGNGMPGMAGHGFRRIAQPGRIILDNTPAGVAEDPSKPGEYVFYVASLDKGDFNVEVKCDPVEFFGPNYTGTPVVASFRPLEPKKAVFDMSTTTFTSGQEATTPGTFTVYDQNGNTVDQGTKVWIKVPNSSGAVAVFLGENGVGNIPTFTPGLVSDNTLTVYKGNEDNTAADTSAEGVLGTQTITVRAGAPDPSNPAFTFTVSNESPIAFQETVTLSGTVVDQAGNPIVGRYLIIKLPGENQSVQAVTGEGGVLQAHGSQPLSYVAGKNGVTQTSYLYDGTTITGDPLKSASATPIKDSTKDGVPVNDGTNLSTVQIDQGTNIDGGVTTLGTVLAAGDENHFYTITVTLKDAYGDPVSGQADNLSLSLADGAAAAGFVSAEGGSRNITFFDGFTEQGNTGVYTKKVHSSNVGSAPLQVTYTKDAYTFQPAVIGGGSLVAVFKAGPADATQSQIIIRDSEGTDVTATGGTAGQRYTAVYIPKDKWGHIIDVEGPVTVQEPSLTTQNWPMDKQSNGEWTVSADMIKAGTANMTVMVGDTAGPTGSFTIAPDKPSMTLSTPNIGVSSASKITPPGTVKRGDTDKFVAMTYLRDTYGNDVNPSKLTVKVSDNGAPFAPASLVSADGVVRQVQVPAQTEGEKLIQFYYNGEPLGQQVRVVVGAKTAGVLDASKSSFQVKPNYPATKPASNSDDDSFSIEITLKDGDNNPLISVPQKDENGEGLLLSEIVLDKKVSAGKDATKVTIYDLVSNGDGTYSAKVKSSLADLVNITVTVQGQQISPKSDGLDKAQFTPLGPDKVDLSYLPDSGVSGQTIANQRVQVTDVNGNLVLPGTKVWVKVLTGDPIELTVDQNGTVRIPDMTLGKVADNQVKAYKPAAGGEGADTSSNLGTKEITITAGEPNNATLTVNSAPVEFTPVEVSGVIKDAAGNPVTAGHKGTLLFPDGSKLKVVTRADGTITSDESGKEMVFTAGAQGVRQSVFLYKAGDDINPVATAQLIPVKNPQEEAKPDFTQGKSRVEITSGEKIANNSDAHTVTVTLVNKYGDPISGKAANLAIENFADGFTTAGDDQNLFLSSFTETGTTGVYTATVKSTKAGSASIATTYTWENDLTSAVLDASGNNRLPAPFKAGPFDKNQTLIQVLDSNSNETSKVAAGQSVTVKVTPTDAHGNPVTLTAANLVATVPGVTSGDVTLAKQPDGTYSATVTPTRPAPAGSNVTFADNGPLVGRTAPLEVTVGKATTVSFKKPDQQSNLAKSSGIIGATNQDPITMQVKDAQGNLMPDGTKVWVKLPHQEELVQVAVSGDQGIAQVPAQTANFTFPATPESITVYGDADKATTLGTLEVSGFVGAPAQYDLSATQNPIEYTSGVKLTGTVKDVQGNLVKGGHFYLVMPYRDSTKTVEVVTDDQGQLKLPGGGDITAVAGKQGVEQYFKLYLTENTSTKAVASAAFTPVKNPADTGVPVFDGDNPSSATITQGEKVANNTDYHEITITLRDKYGPLTDAADKLVITNSASGFVTDEDGKNLTIAAPVHEGNGVYKVKVTSTKAGTAQLSVSFKYTDPDDAVTMIPVSSGSLPAAFKAGPVDLTNAENSNFALTSGNRVANGTDFHTITVKLADAFGNPITGQVGNLSATATPADGVSILNFTAGTTAGTYTAKVTATASGEKTIAVTLSNQAVPVQASGKDKANFTPGAIDKNNSELNVDKESPKEGETVTVTGSLKDANENPIPGHNVTVVLPDGTTIPAKTDSSGNIVRRDDPAQPITFGTADKQGETLTVKLYDGDDTSPSATALKTKTVTVVMDPDQQEKPVNPSDDPNADLAKSSYARITDGKRLANGIEAHVVTVILKNKYGQTLADKASFLSLKLDAAAAGSAGYCVESCNDGANLFFSEFTQVSSRSIGDGVSYRATITSTKAGIPVVKAVFADGTTTLDPIQPVANTKSLTRRDNLPAEFVLNGSTFAVTHADGSEISSDKPVMRGNQVLLTYTAKDANDQTTQLSEGATVKATVPGITDPVTLTYNPSKQAYTATVTLNQPGSNRISVQTKEPNADDTLVETDNKSQTVTVNTNEPTLSVNDTGTTATGQVDPGSTVTACVTLEGESTCTPIDSSKITVDEDGNYTIDTSQVGEDGKPLNDGDKIKVTVDNNGSTSEKEVTVDVKPAAPQVSIDKQTDGSYKVTVTPAEGSRNVTSATVKVNGTTVTTQQVGSPVTYTYTIPQDQVPPSTGTVTVSATVTDSSGNTSDETTASKNGFDTPAPTNVKANATGITGDIDSSVPVGSQVKIYAPNGQTVIGTGTVVNEGGQPKVKANYDAGKKPEGDSTIYVSVVDSNTGRESAKTPATVKDGMPTAPGITLDKEQPTKVTGTTDPGTTVEVCVQTGSQQPRCSQATVTGGTYDATVNPQIQHGDKVTVTATNPEGNQTSSTTTVDWVAPEAPDLDITENDNGTVTITVTPKAGEDNQGTPALTVGDETVDLTDNGDGTYSYTTTTPATQDTAVSATVTDAAGNTSNPPATGTISKVTTPDLTNVKANATTVSGDADASVPEGSTVTIYKGDDVLGTTTVENGKFTFTYPDATQIQDGDTLHVQVTDKNTNVPSGKTPVKVDASKPTVTVNPTNGDTVTGKVTSKIDHDGESDPTVKVTYTDKEGNQQTKDATVTCTQQGTNKVCEYSADLPDDVDTTKPITVTATDEAGNTGEATTTPDTVAPVVTVNPTKGDKAEGTVDDEDATVTVTYTDEGGTVHKDVPAPVTCSGDGADKKCTYSVDLNPPAADGSVITVTAKDPAGNKANVTAKADSTAPGLPTIDATEGKANDVVTGKVEKGAKVTLKYTNEEGTEVTVTSPDAVTVDANGNYSYTLPERVKNQTDIKVTATDEAGNTSDEATYTVDRNKPALTVNPTNGTSVTGTTSQGATVKVTYTGTDGSPHEVDATVTTDPQTGKTTFVADLPDGQVDTTKPIKVTATKEGVDNQVSVMADTEKPDKPQNINVSDDGKVVTGEGEPGATVTVTLPDGTTATGEVDPSGNFSVTLPDGKQVDEGQTITVNQTDPAGNTSDDTTFTKDTTNTLKIDPIPQDGSQITGKTDPGSSVTVKDKDNNVLGPVVADGEGNFTIPIPADKRPKAGDTFTVTSTDPAGHVAEGTITYSPQPPSAPTIDGIEGDTVVGTPADDNQTVEVCVTRTDGTRKCVEGEVENGRYTAKLPDGPLQPGDTLSVRSQDKDTGAWSLPTTYIQPVPDQPQPAPEPSTLEKTGVDSMWLLAITLMLTAIGTGVLWSSRIELEYPAHLRRRR